MSINYEQTVTTFYEIMTEHCSNQIKKIMQAQIETSASALGSYQTVISSFKAFGREQTETIQGQILFFFLYFFTFSSSDVIELTF